MSNAPGTKASRHEAIEFAAVSHILQVDVQLGDDSGQNSVPDGKWGAQNQRGVIDITALPDKRHMSSWAEANISGKAFIESGSKPLLYGKLHRWIQEFLEEEWALQNISKLTAQKANERHLYLHAYSARNQELLNRLSDIFIEVPQEPIGLFKLPGSINSVWFEGRAARVAGQPGRFVLNLARFSRENHWNRYEVILDDVKLPPADPQPGQSRDSL